MILLIAGIINRILGFIPRIALPRIIGAEGVGLYQLSFPFLTVMLTIITGGIPLAVAKWIAEAESQGDSWRVKSIFRAALAIVILLGLLMTAVMLLFAPWITAHLLPDPRVYRTFLAMSPILLISGISAVYRGYFQGKQNMIPSAVSQIVETVLRIFAMLGFALLLMPLGLEWAAAGAMLGVVVGEIGGLLVLLWKYKQAKKITPNGEEPASDSKLEQEPGIVRRLLKLSIPVTGNKLAGSLSYLLETIFTARSLVAAGIASGLATAQYGALQGMIVPLVLLPTALTYSLAVSLVPSLSEAAAKGDHATIHKRLHQSMRLALVTGAPFVVVMALFAEPICRILYNHADIAPMLQLIAPAGLFIYLQAPLQATLQALDKPGVALMNTLIGAAVKLALIVYLASDAKFGIYGAVIAINVNIVLVTVLHGISVLRTIGFHMHLLDFIKVGAAMVIMGAAAQFTMNRQALPAEWTNLLLACLLGTAVYLGLMIVTKIVDRHDMARIPLLGRWLS